jgi:ATF/CREB family transcription factor
MPLFLVKSIVAAVTSANHVEDAAAAKQDETVKAETSTSTEPLAPPPRPDPSAPVSQTPDYFSVAHDGSLSYETNPFEHSFASGGSAGTTRGDQTPGGTKLPSVASLTSPSGLLGSSATPNFWGSLRSGPLSPAMLSGPQKDDYFSDGHHLRGGFPTPNESSLRSGLTPGGGGSMFPEPSPNSQALFNQLAGAATPGTLDFQRTALNAAAAQRKIPHSQPSVTSQPQDLPNGLDGKPQVPGPFDQHDANDAANGLYLLAQAQTRNGSQLGGHYAMAAQMPVHAHPQPMMQMSGQATESSPSMTHDATTTTDGRGVSTASGQSDENDQPNRPNTRGKGKRTSGQANQTSGRRKADETPSKGPTGKKAKGNTGHAMEPEPLSEEEQDVKDEYHANGKKMTDEEKRKNFLERNRFVCSLKSVARR